PGRESPGRNARSREQMGTQLDLETSCERTASPFFLGLRIKTKSVKIRLDPRGFALFWSPGRRIPCLSGEFRATSKGRHEPAISSKFHSMNYPPNPSCFVPVLIKCMVFSVKETSLVVRGGRRGRKALSPVFVVGR